MSSYNKLNGTYTSEEYDLLTTILRKEWGYKGLVMTDWYGGNDPVAQMKAGNDLLMPGTPPQSERIINAVIHDSLDVKVLDENVARILNIILKSPSFHRYHFLDNPNLKKNAAISRMAASEGMVLLENKDRSLPLGNVKMISVFGNTSYAIIAGGTGSGDVNKAYTVSLVQGLSKSGYVIDNKLKNLYSGYLREQRIKHPKKSIMEELINPSPPIPEYLTNVELINKKASETDIAIITIGRNSGEGSDRKLENDFNLSDIESNLIKDVGNAFHSQGKKVIVVLNIGGVIEMASWRSQVDALLLAWQPGLEGGNAISDILSGRVNPSGKLATTFPLVYADVPSAKSFPGKEYPEQATGTGFFRKVPAEVIYNEGIYVGYRYYNTFKVKTAYDFGYGLSYTNFTYSNLALNSNSRNGKITASITISNRGTVAGKEVVQLYISAPAIKSDKPVQELKAFTKTGLLQPGKSERLTFAIYASDLASFYTPSSSWIAEAGKYSVNVGCSSTNIQQIATFELPREIIVKKVHKVLYPEIQINEMKH